MDFTFSFYFPNLDQDRQVKVVKSWGGNVGTAFNRAWKKVKNDCMYKGIKSLRPDSVGIARTPESGG